jgi:hypothetical protein
MQLWVKLGCAIGRRMHSEVALLLAAMLSAIAGPVPASGNAKSASHFTTFQCIDGRAFDVLFANSTARVHFAGGEYFLQKRRSSLGTKFVSPTATLIVDGEYAAFVPDGTIDLWQCKSL